jgi:putative ABC transport system permease protein
MRRLYRILLLAFPRALRRSFGDEMTALFVSQVGQARESGASVIGVVLLAIADAAVHGASERAIQIRRGSRDLLRGTRRWRWWVRNFLQDVRYAARLLMRQPGTTGIAIVTLALGIGANTAIFSAVDAVLLRPLPYEEPDRLMMVWEKRPAEGVLDNVVAPADYLDWASMNTVFDSMAGMTTITADLTGNGEPIRLGAAAVGPSFFDVLRVRPLLGRTFTKDDAVPGRHQVIVLNHGLWADRFGSDPSIVGRTVSLNGVPHEVIGVVPASFEFPDAEVTLWAPLAFDTNPAPSRSSHSLSVYARLKPGVSLAQARAGMDQVAEQLSRAHPDTNRTHGAWVSPLATEVAAPVRSGLLLLLGAVAFVLLIACVNVANLLLTRAAGRRREMAVRAALGAARGRLVGQTMTESLLLGLAGGAAGLLVASWGIGLIRILTPESTRVIGLNHLSLDWRVLLFALALSLATAVLFGVLPAWQLANQDVNAPLQQGGRGGTPIRKSLRTALVVSEIALASLLLVGAGLTLRSFRVLLQSEPGFRPREAVTALVTFPGSRYRSLDTRLATLDQIEQRFRALPGARAVGTTSHLPLSGRDGRQGVVIEGRTPPADGSPTRAHARGVTPDYFSAIGIQLMEGRPFATTDRTDGPLVAIVNETMARRYWPGRSPVGGRVLLAGTKDWRQVVGVIRDVRHWGLDRDVNPELYMPLAQSGYPTLNLVVSTAGDPAATASAMREKLRMVDGDLALSYVRPLEAVAARSTASRRTAMLMLAIFATVALVLAAAGIYGVMSHLVSLRAPEIGVRMTLGATPQSVLRLIMREALQQAVIGLTVGIAGAVVLMQFFGGLLYGIRPADPITLVSVAALLLATAVLACLVPARRAMRVDVVEVLRS